MRDVHVLLYFAFWEKQQVGVRMNSDDRLLFRSAHFLMGKSLYLYLFSSMTNSQGHHQKITGERADASKINLKPKKTEGELRAKRQWRKGSEGALSLECSCGHLHGAQRW